MSMVYNQRKKLHKDTLLFGYGKRNFKLKAFRRLLRECIETYLLKTQYALLHPKSLFVQVPNIIEV